MTGGCGCNLQVRQPLVVGAGRLKILFAQFGGAPELAGGELDLRIPLRQLRPRRGERGLVRPWIDDEQQIAFFDELTILEVGFPSISADPGADLDMFLGGELPGVFVPFDELTRCNGWLTVTAGGGAGVAAASPGAGRFNAIRSMNAPVRKSSVARTSGHRTPKELGWGMSFCETGRAAQYLEEMRWQLEQCVRAPP